MKFQLLADREATWGQSRYWKEFAIGHAGSRSSRPAATDSWGYWPDLEGGHAARSATRRGSRCRARLHPDTDHSPNAIQTHEIDAEHAEKVEKAANDKEASPGSYNLFSYNCTTFATQMAKIAGVPVPSFSTLGIANPNSLFAGHRERNKAKGLTPMETPLPRDGVVGN